MEIKKGRPRVSHIRTLRIYRSSIMMLAYLRRHTGWTNARVVDEALKRMYEAEGNNDNVSGQ